MLDADPTTQGLCSLTTYTVLLHNILDRKNVIRLNPPVHVFFSVQQYIIHSCLTVSNNIINIMQEKQFQIHLEHAYYTIKTSLFPNRFYALNAQHKRQLR